MMGARIAALRQTAGMSQSELAKKLQVSPSTVGMYEQGRREPALNILVSMAEVFDVSLDYLITGKAADNEERTKLNKMLESRIGAVNSRLDSRPERPFSRQELAVLMAAMLMDP